jgi:hypothetical protein
MKRTLRSLGMLIITVLLTFGLAQQTQQQTGQQTQQTQEQQTGQQDQQNQQNQDQQGQQGQNQQDQQGQQGTQGQQGQQNQQGDQGQQGQQGMQNQQGQQQGQQGQQGMQGQQNQQLTDMLMELRQIQAELGQIINDLERQLRLSTTGGFEDRVGALERSARAGALREARRDLRGLRTDIEAGERGEETAREIGRIRADLRRAFTGVTGEEQQRANELEQQLGTLEEQVRTGATEAGTTLQDVLTHFDEELDRNQQQFEQEGRQRTIQTAIQRLEGLRADIEGGRYHEGVIGEIGQIRGDVERTFRGAEGEEQQWFDELTAQFQTLEEQLRAGDEQARQTFEDVTQRFQQQYSRIDQNQNQGGSQGEGTTGQGN